ncbi:restriction endonuclease subunit S [Sphingobacterium siyangense]|uniref:restriction endonuclease subunit S n=1 Tax=Sphingobacterium siyangense TaxID=459529 RepID=UPI003DA3DAFA
MQRYEKYKDSGIDWLGEIPEHWEDRKLGNILHPYSVKNRADLPLLSITREKGVIRRGEDTEEDNHNFIPDDLSGYKHLKVGQFGMNKMKAWQGSYGYSNFEGIVSPAYYIFDISSNLFGEYFSKTIRSKAYIPFFTKASDGVRIGQWDLAKQRMKEIPFYVPPLNEQKAITKFLDDKCKKIDEAINLKEQQIEKLKELRQITIHDAVTKGISHFKGEVVPTKDSGIDWIGEIPEHWEVKKLKYLYYLTGGGTPSKENSAFWNGSIPWVSPKDMKAKWIEKTEDYISEVAIQNSSTKLIPKNSLLLVVRSGILQRTLPLCFAKVDLTINQDIKAITVKSKMTSEFLYYYILGLERFLLKEWVKDGATVESIEISYLENTKLIFPSLFEQQEIVAYLEEQTSKIDKAIVQRQEQIVKLKEYKQSLINEAVTGKIKIIA